MVVLAMDERREPVARITLDPLPNVEDRAASGVDHHAPDLAKDLEVGNGDAKGREDYDILGLHAAEIDTAILGHEKGYPHGLEFRIYVRIMDDLAGQIDGTIRELLPGLISVLYR